MTNDHKQDEVLVNDGFMRRPRLQDTLGKRLETMQIQGVPLKRLLSIHVYLALFGLSFLVLASLLGLSQPTFLAAKLDAILRGLQISGFGLIALSFLPLNVSSKVAMTSAFLLACGFIIV